MHAFDGTFNLAVRDWSETPRSQWSTGKAWTFEGTFAKDNAKKGVFKDGIENSERVKDGIENSKTVTTVTVHQPMTMPIFWIEAKLIKDDDKPTKEERQKLILPDTLYKRRACIDISIQTCQGLIEPSYISARYSTQGSRTTTCGQRASTCRQHSHAQSVYSFARLYDSNTDMLLVLQ